MIGLAPSGAPPLGFFGVLAAVGCSIAVVFVIVVYLGAFGVAAALGGC